jgi:hypothetical protein
LWERKIKRRALVDLSFRPYSTAMTADDTMDICESDTCAFEILLPVQALKDPKEFIGILHVETNTVIADKDDCFDFIASFATDLDLRDLSRTGEFQGVRDQVNPDNAQHGSITDHHW